MTYRQISKIILRDLKPENLLLDSNKPDSAIKVIDFGASKKFDDLKMKKKLVTPF